MKTTNYETKDWILFIHVLKLELLVSEKKESEFCNEYKNRTFKGEIAQELTMKSVKRYLNFSELEDDKPIKITPTRKKFIRIALEILQSLSGEELDYITVDTLMSYCETAFNNGLIKNSCCHDKDDLEVYQKQIREPALKQATSLKEKSGKYLEFQENSLIKDIYIDAQKEVVKTILCERFETKKSQKILLFYNLYRSFSNPIKKFWEEFVEYLLEFLELNLDTSEFAEYCENANDDYIDFLYNLSLKSICIDDLTIHDITDDFKNLLLLKEDNFKEVDICGKGKITLEQFRKGSKKLDEIDLYTAYEMYLIWQTDDKQKRNFLVDVALRYCLLPQSHKQ